MDVATGAMRSLLPKLRALLSEEYNLERGVKADVHFLSSELTNIQAALLVCSEVPQRQLNEQVRLWSSEVRELSYHIEDVVDNFLMCEDSPEATTNSHKLKRLMEKMVNLFRKGKTRHQISDAIKDIKEKVRDVSERRAKYRVDDNIVANPATATTTIDPRLLVLYKDQKELVGTEEARDELIKRLEHENDDASKQQVKTVSIFGLGGLGKTTLAKVVYDRLRAQFHCGAFVLVGRNPDLRKVLEDIFYQLHKQKYMASKLDKLDEEQLIDILRQLLENKRYIIVIDDIWDHSERETISQSLVRGNYGSRVIITTRNFSVARLAGDVYKLKPLSPDNSEKLLYTRLFGAKGRCPYGQSGRVCKKILQKCEGVPSTIVTIASFLASKPREDWPKVYDSIEFGYGGNGDIENMKEIRLFSYYDLPNHLKTCLLHLSIFPENYTIMKETLIWKWIAEGFIHEQQGLDLFEVGESFFNELIDRSMIEPVEIPYEGTIFGCRVYGSVLDIISFLSKEENFVTILDSNKHHTSSQSNARRLAVQKRVLDQHNPLANTRVTQVRSFNATMSHISTVPSLSGFQVLRVLAIEDCTFMEGRNYHLDHLGRLLLLRYLGLLNTPIRELPKEIGNLRFLQTLDLRGTGIEELPQTVGLLRQLMCLRTEGGSIRVPDGVRNLASLEELRLSNVSKSPNFLKELGELIKLRVLEISIEGLDGSSIEALLESVCKLQKIQVLKLMGGLSIDEAKLEGYVPPRSLRHLHLAMECSGLPPWINSSALPLLSHLWVGVKAVQAQDVEILGELPELVSLTLLMPLVVSISLDGMGAGAFPKLRHCYTSAPLRFLPGAMPSLESIKFEVKVRALKDADFEFDFSSLGNLPRLQKVTVQIFCLGASATEVEAAEAAVKQAVDLHPKRPMLELTKDQQEEQERAPSVL